MENNKFKEIYQQTRQTKKNVRELEQEIDRLEVLIWEKENNYKTIDYEFPIKIVGWEIVFLTLVATFAIPYSMINMLGIIIIVTIGLGQFLIKKTKEKIKNSENHNDILNNEISELKTKKLAYIRVLNSKKNKT
ncbi:hypothetical protein [Paraclostridium sordellii]|uniref:hypothetical protein n=1 Tax=Paraclostridium sordellii TaxID=1505 RepID=UPI001C613BA3|nr:hypothetical protein [Paeniclostridium sordellii]QYE96656.1 hypothetical protein KZ987_10340 [Paeniclostridium sordellii]